MGKLSQEEVPIKVNSIQLTLVKSK